MDFAKVWLHLYYNFIDRAFYICEIHVSLVVSQFLFVKQLDYNLVDVYDIGDVMLLCYDCIIPIKPIVFVLKMFFLPFKNFDYEMILMIIIVYHLYIFIIFFHFVAFINVNIYLNNLCVDKILPFNNDTFFLLPL